MKKILLSILALIFCVAFISCENGSAIPADNNGGTTADGSEPISEIIVPAIGEESSIDDNVDISIQNPEIEITAPLDEQSGTENSEIPPVEEGPLSGTYEYSERINGTDYIISLFFTGNEVECTETENETVAFRRCTYVLNGNELTVSDTNGVYFSGIYDEENDTIDAMGYVFTK